MLVLLLGRIIKQNMQNSKMGYDNDIKCAVLYSTVSIFFF